MIFLKRLGIAAVGGAIIGLIGFVFQTPPIFVFISSFLFGFFVPKQVFPDKIETEGVND